MAETTLTTAQAILKTSGMCVFKSFLVYAVYSVNFTNIFA